MTNFSIKNKVNIINKTKQIKTNQILLSPVCNFKDFYATCQDEVLGGEKELSYRNILRNGSKCNSKFQMQKTHLLAER